MRAFLCDFKDFTLAIPMNSVSSLALHEESGELDEQNSYVSLPELFKLPLEFIRHNIILKSPGVDEADAAENNTILFIPEIECETEVPDEEIFPVPKILSGTQFSFLFSGIQFGSRLSGNGPVLMLNTEQLAESFKRK